MNSHQPGAPDEPVAVRPAPAHPYASPPPPAPANSSAAPPGRAAPAHPYDRTASSPSASSASAWSSASRPATRSTPPGRPAPRRRYLSSFLWATALSLLAVLAGCVGQLPLIGLFAGAALCLAVVATGAVLVGGFWHRAGAATLLSIALFALPLFAGPTLYELYVKQTGERTETVVLGTGTRESVDGDDLSVCVVRDGASGRREISQQQNCYGQFERGEHVYLYEDPLDVLDPWIEAKDAPLGDPVSLACTGGVFALAWGTAFYGGLRRRPADRRRREEEEEPDEDLIGDAVEQLASDNSSSGDASSSSSGGSSGGGGSSGNGGSSGGGTGSGGGGGGFGSGGSSSGGGGGWGGGSSGGGSGTGGGGGGGGGFWDLFS